MFNLFGSKKDQEQLAKNIANAVKPILPKETKVEKNQREFYRIGYDHSTNMTTLTLLGDNGFSMTLSLSKDGCEQMIRMIRATYDTGTESAS
jgi:molybdopterin biosynthesis enzyme